VVITRETRDVFLQYLHKIITDSNIEVAKGQEHIPTTDVTHATEDTETVFSKDNYNTHTTTSITGFNKTITELVENKYESMKKELDEIQSRFSESWLKGALNTEEQFDRLKTVRKQLTQFHVASSKTLKAAHMQTTTRKHYICQMQKNLIPNRLNQEALDKIDNGIDKFASKINADLCSQMLADTQNIIRKTQELISNEESVNASS